jgi:hypothetical protein
MQRVDHEKKRALKGAPWPFDNLIDCSAAATPPRNYLKRLGPKRDGRNGDDR